MDCPQETGHLSLHDNGHNKHIEELKLRNLQTVFTLSGPKPCRCTTGTTATRFTNCTCLEAKYASVAGAKEPAHFTELLWPRGKTSVNFKSFLFDHLLRQLLLQLRDAEEVVVMMQNWDIKNPLNVQGLQTTHQRERVRVSTELNVVRSTLCGGDDGSVGGCRRGQELLKFPGRAPAPEGPGAEQRQPRQSCAARVHEDSDTTPRMTHGAAKPAETPAARTQCGRDPPSPTSESSDMA